MPRIGFTDGADARVLEACGQLEEQKLATPVVIGSTSEIEATCRLKNVPRPRQMMDGGSAEKRQKLAQVMADRQAKDNLTLEAALQQLTDPLYLGVALLLEGEVDGLIAGSLRPTADVVKAALKCVGPAAGQRLISGHFLMETDHRHTAQNTPFLFADCAVVPEPSPRTLAAIAISAAASYRFFTGQVPRVALLSFSTRGSADHPLVDRIREAVQLVRKQAPDLIIDGELQVDAALDSTVAAIKGASDSQVTGQANVFVFPTLEAGNIGYKLIQRFGKARIAGPLLWGLNRPMSDLSRGCTVEEIVDTARCVSSMIRGVN
jgi:phosphate acetyltransferase